MKNVYIDTKECLSLYEDTKKELISLDELLDKYEQLHDAANHLQEETERLKTIIREIDSNYNYDM